MKPWFSYGSLTEMKHHIQKAKKEGKNLCGPFFDIAVIIKGKQDIIKLQQGRNLESGADKEAMEWCCSLTCSP